MVENQIKRLEAKKELVAYTQALETDLILMIEKYIFPKIGEDPDWSYIKSSQIRNKAIGMFLEEYSDDDPRKNVKKSIEFLDFADPFSILSAHKKELNEKTRIMLSELNLHWQEVIDIRNRASHPMRRLLAGQFSSMQELVNRLVSKNPEIWINLENQLYSTPQERLDYIKNQKKENIEDDNSIITNLPVPSHNETGFIGRTQTIKTIIKRLEQSNIVSILGEGGVGKTALAQEIGHIYYEKESPFEQIFYCSLKTEALDKAGIRQLREEMPSMPIVFKEIDQETYKTGDDDLKQVLGLSPSLIIIDNLETLPDEVAINELRELQSIRAQNSHQNTKILITSRRGLGRLEDPVTIKNLEKKEGVKLFREMLKIRQIDLAKSDDEFLGTIVDKVESHPVSLWWIANRLEMAAPLENIMRNPLNEVVDYCIGDSINNLSHQEELILRMIQRLDGARMPQIKIGLDSWKGNNENNISLDDLTETINSFNLMSLIDTQVNKDQVSIYSITNNVSSYLSNHYPSQKISNQLNKAMAQLKDTPYSDIKKEEDIFELRHFLPSSQEEAFFSKSLLKLLDQVGKSKKADNLAIQAKKFRKNFTDLKMQTNYSFSEVFRVSAFFESQVDPYSDLADADYLKAITLSGKSDPKLCFWYASFLARRDRFPEARNYLNKIIDKYSQHPKIIRLHARILFEQNAIDEAIENLQKALLETHDSDHPVKDMARLIQDLIHFSIRYPLAISRGKLDQIELDKVLKSINFITNPKFQNMWDRTAIYKFGDNINFTISNIGYINTILTQYDYSMLIKAICAFPGKFSQEIAQMMKNNAKRLGLLDIYDALEAISPLVKKYKGTITHISSTGRTKYGKDLFVRFTNEDNEKETVSGKLKDFAFEERDELEKGMIVIFSLGDFIPRSDLGEIRMIYRASIFRGKYN